MSSVKRAIQVLDLLAHEGTLGVRAISHHLALPIGSVHRLLIELEEENVIERTAEGSWQLSYRLLEISDLQLEGVAIPRLARKACQVLAEQTGETVNINMLSGDACVCIHKARGSEVAQLDWRIGSRGPLYCGGSAKAMLAFMPVNDQVRIANDPKTQFTAHTLTDASALLIELRHIRERGYSIDNQEMVLGVFCVGVPIIDRAGRPVGAVSVSGPSPKAAGQDIASTVADLTRICSDIGDRLGSSLVSAPVKGRMPLSAVRH